MIIRELITMLGVEFDDSGAKKATSALEEIKSLAGKVAAGFGASRLLGGLYGFVEQAAATSETVSLLRVTFGQYNDEMVKWADEQAGVLGRSKYSLREYAAQIGVVAKGLTDNSKQAARIAKDFGALSVDLKAFFDLASDEDAMGALRSGLTGETEPLKRLGIVMNEAALEAFRLKKHISSQYKDMKPAEQAWLRYQFIMESATAQMASGASAREAQSFGNRMAVLKDRFKDLSIEIGTAFLPMAHEVLDVFDDWKYELQAVADIISDLATKTYFFEWILGILAFKTGIAAINMMIKLYRAARTMVLLNFIGAATGLSKIATAFTAVGTAAKAAWVSMAPVVTAIGLALAWVVIIAAIGIAIAALAQTLATGTNFLAEWTEEAFGLQSAIVEGIGYIVEWAGSCWESIVKGAKWAASGIIAPFEFMWGVLKILWQAGVDALKAMLAAVIPDRVLDVLAAVGIDLRGADAAAGARTTAGATAPPGTTTSATTTNVSSGPVNVTINGNATPGTAHQVGKEVASALAQNNRTLAATAPGSPR